ncbi:hypothetical protein CRI94_12015 [Longibacter salinarum]|uniref:Uncharacterized protein n=1 Tax=Longibacter salinarum TaxID=1850348 RepID=A0A2A8CVS1_9BACT|nr:hypothetical protein [Longibacter salinarum]PEN12746.1 hypothetical protein CRI94_12015 [Longibacter salinarum]
MSADNPLFDVEPSSLDDLDGGGLTKVLRELVWLELYQHGGSLSKVHIPLNITVRDGGIDGRVQWEGDPPPENLSGFNSRDTAFQVKATNVGPSACKEELLDSSGNDLKPGVKRVLQEGASYVLVNNRQLTYELINDRIEKMREAVRESNADLDSEDIQFDVIDASKLVNWARQYPSVITLIRRLTNQRVSNGFIRWEDWAGNTRLAANLAVSDEMSSNMEWIRSRLSNPGSVSRIVGLSGLGKTRLALEALRNPEQNEISDDDNGALGIRDYLNKLVLYAKEGDINEPDLLRSVRGLVQAQVDAVVVVDDCRIAFHDRLASIVDRGGSRVRLLTLDYDFDKGEGRGERVELSPEVQRPVVRKMLEETPAARGLSKPDLERVEEFAQGFPLIAELLLETWETEGVGGDTLSDERLITRMLFGRSDDPEKRHMIRCCALFAYFGVAGDLDHQLQFIAEEVADVDPRRFHRVCNEFKLRSIIQERGRYMRVRPLPLALRLAAEWWQTAPPVEAEELLRTAHEAGLVDSLCLQLERLSEVENAREIAGELCEDGSPFTRAEVLRTSAGGRIFRALAVLNPPAAAGALERAFGDKSTDELLEVKDGRRALVRALEHLVFHRESFLPAARILHHFAAAETEGWANNATGRFKRLFHVYLSGTQVPAPERLTVLKDGLESDDAARRRIAIEALGSALKTKHFTRDVGDEAKGRVGGSGPHDWTPDRYEEIYEYWEGCLDLLVDKIKNGGDEGALARKQLEGTAGSLLAILGISRKAEESIRVAAEGVDGVWRGALQAVGRALGTRPGKMPEGLRSRLERLRDDLQPTDLVGKLEYVVTSPPQSEWVRRTEDGEYLKVAEQRARTLARDLANDDEADWTTIARVLCTGRQKFARVFGIEIASILEDPVPVIEDILEVLEKIPEDKGRHWGLLAGLISQVTQSQRNHALTWILQSDTLRSEYWRILSSVGVEEDDLDSLLDIIKEGSIAARDLTELTYSFHDVSPGDLSNFALQVLEESVEYGPALLEIIQSYQHNREETSRQLRDVQRQIVLTSLRGLTLTEDLWQRSYSWRDAIVSLLSGEDDDELARAVASQIVKTAESASPSTSLAYELDQVVEALFKEYVDTVWETFSDALLSGSYKSMAITAIVASNPVVSTSETAPGGPLFRSIDDDFLIDWSHNNTPQAPVLLAETVPIFDKPNDSNAEQRAGLDDEPTNPVWYPLARRILDEFGEVDEVRSALRSNMFSFSSTGSRIPYYKRRIGLLEELLEHDVAAVRQWATEEIAHHREVIKRERQQEEEEDMRWRS